MVARKPKKKPQGLYKFRLSLLDRNVCNKYRKNIGLGIHTYTGCPKKTPKALKLMHCLNLNALALS